MLCVAQVAMSLLRSQMRNQLINYCFGAASLRHFRDGKVNQGRQSLTLHLARDVADRLERRFEPIPPATLSVSLSRRAVGRKDQGPVSADPFFVSQLIRVEAQRSFGVLIARLHRAAVALLDRPINQLTGQGQFAREGDLPVGVITADTLENLAQIFALLTL